MATVRRISNKGRSYSKSRVVLKTLLANSYPSSPLSSSTESAKDSEPDGGGP